MLKIGSVIGPSRIIESHRLSVDKSRDGRIRLAGAELSNSCGFIDMSWLKSASEEYRISSNPQDYILVELPIVTADYPNRNMDAFPYEELTRFKPLLGRITYQTFISKPCHQDHDNKDPRKAKGTIFDASMIPLEDGLYHVKILAGFDRTKDTALCRDIQNKRRTGYSMGALVGHTLCSYCKFQSDGRSTCEHIANGAGKGKALKGVLLYELCCDVNFIETSSVGDPADVTATSERFWV